MVCVIPPCVESRHKNFLLRDLTLQGLQGGGDHTLELWSLLSSVCIKQGDSVSVLRGHGVWPNVLDVGNEKIAIVWSAHCGGVDVLHHEPEQVVVPLEDEVPEVSFEEMFSSVEESPAGLDRYWGDGVLRLQVRHHGGEGAAEGALTVEGTFELEVGTVPLVFLLLGQSVGLSAAHGVVPTGELEQSGHLLHPEVPLLRHVGPAGGTVGQPGEAVTADQVALGALLDGGSDVVQTDGTLQQRQQAGGVDQSQLQVGLLHQDGVHVVCL